MTVLKTPEISLVEPYKRQLLNGWSPTTGMQKAFADAELKLINENPSLFIQSIVDPEGKGPPVLLPDGQQVPRIPGTRFWIYDADDEFCGSISLRWASDGGDLPKYVLGHTGYFIVPEKRGRRLAATALDLLKPKAKALKVREIDIVIARSNSASIRSAELAGALYVGAITTPPQQGGEEMQKFRITTD